jgi:TonB-dependent SusC/RagA subfamily outer membrane receptor
MLRKLLFAVFVALLYTGSAVAQTGTITGNVTDATSGETLPGANVLVVDLDKGTSTDANGNFRITEVPPGTHTVRVTYVGYNQANKTVTVEAGEIAELNFELGAGVDLGQVVVTALGQEVEENTISFSSPELTSEQLNIADNDNIRTSLAGKVAGVQVLGQAGSKLGAFGNIRLRGAISLTDDLSEPLYVVDGVPMNNPNMINLNDVQDVNVLKGPNATALYGQRGENGVILITTKEGSETGVSAEVNFSMTLDRVAYLPNFQNKYGQGYSQGDFATFQYDASYHPSYFQELDGARYLTKPYSEESGGPRL